MTDSRRKAAPANAFIITAILVGFAIEVVTGAWTQPIELAKLGAVVPPLIFEYGQYWRLVTAMFLHGNGTIQGTLLHLIVNLIPVVQIGSLFERMFGSRRYLFLYFTTGIVASLTSAIVARGWSVGASGAIFGILGAFVTSVMTSPRLRIDPFSRSIVNQLVFWILANLIILSQVPQIDHAAHIGGLVSGGILGALLPDRTPPPPPAQVVIDVMPYDEGSAGDPAAQRDDR